MSIIPDYAIPTRIASIGHDDSLIDQKLLLVGRMLCYDSTTGFILLWDRNDALLVDVVLCLDRGAKIWLQDAFCSIQVIGHLEKSSKELLIPVMPPHLVQEPRVPSRFILRAIKIEPWLDIEQNLWNNLAEEVRMHAQVELNRSESR